MVYFHTFLEQCIFEQCFWISKNGREECLFEYRSPVVKIHFSGMFFCAFLNIRNCFAWHGSWKAVVNLHDFPPCFRFVNQVNSAAVTIQRWYRWHSQRHKEGVAQLERLLASKREVCLMYILYKKTSEHAERIFCFECFVLHKLYMHEMWF